MYSNDSNWAYELRSVFEALARRRRVIVTTFIVAATALAAVFFLSPSKAVCLMSVKKPSEIFVPLGEQGIAASAAVPLLEGQTYKEMVRSFGFAAEVATALQPRKVNLAPAAVHRRIGAEFKDPDMLRVTGSDINPALAVLLANTACQTLGTRNLHELRGHLKEQETAIAQLLAAAHHEVQRNLAALSSYAERHGLLNVNWDSNSSQLYHALELMGNQQMSLAQQQAALEQDTHNLQVLQTPDGGHADVLDFPVQDPAIATDEAQIEQVRKDLWDAEKVYTPDHPVVKDLTYELHALKARLATRVNAMKEEKKFHPSPEWKLAIAQSVADTQSRIVGEKAEIQAWTDLIDQQRKALGAVPEEAAEVNKMKVALNFAEDRYQQLAQQLDQTRVSLKSAQGSLSVIQPAIGAEPPGALLLVVICTGLLLGLPVGMGLFVDYLSDSVHSPVGFARDLGEICLGAVPSSRYLTSRHLRNGDSLASLEEFRVMRSSLGLVWGRAAPRAIGIVSGHTREGRSTVVLQLARALVEDHKRIAILDADVRTTGVAPKLGLQPTAGILQVLSGENTVDDALIPVAEGVELLPGKAHGKVVPINAELLFQDKRFQECIEQLKTRADVVLVDMPPLLEFPDCAEMLRHVEAVVLVVKGENRQRATETAWACLDLLRNVDTRRLGIVVNHVDA